MRKTSQLGVVAAVSVALLLSADISQAQKRGKDNLGPGKLAMKIRPEQLQYNIQIAKSGGIRIFAEVENNGTETVLFGHPNICFPEDWQTGQGLVRDQSRSHLSVMIEDPSGMTTTLMNNGLRMFDPGFRDSMTILPDQTVTFSLAMFGPEYSLGQWNIDRAVFTELGMYRITASYKNGNAVGYLVGPSDKRLKANCWIGHLKSNAISVQVK